MDLLTTFHYTYVLFSEKDGKRYIGYTHNLILRLDEHQKVMCSINKAQTSSEVSLF
jgi:predicted GIY-YIG superfamily endonuclease